MRTLLVAAALFLPATLTAQYPEPGKYTLAASQVGSEQVFNLFLGVTVVGDSTSLSFGQGEDNPIPLAEQGLIAGGFFFRFGGIRCPFVRVDSRWEAICADSWDTPQFTMTITGKADQTPS